MSKDMNGPLPEDDYERVMAERERDMAPWYAKKLPVEDACPVCGECRPDSLDFDPEAERDHDLIRCATCGSYYRLKENRADWPEPALHDPNDALSFITMDNTGREINRYGDPIDVEELADEIAEDLEYEEEMSEWEGLAYADFLNHALSPVWLALTGPGGLGILPENATYIMAEIEAHIGEESREEWGGRDSLSRHGDRDAYSLEAFIPDLPDELFE